MNTLSKLLCCLSNELDIKENDSEEVKKQSGKCQILFEKLNLTLNDEQKKIFSELDFENFMLCGQWKTDGFNEGLEAGFKYAVQLIFDTVRS